MDLSIFIKNLFLQVYDVDQFNSNLDLCMNNHNGDLHQKIVNNIYKLLEKNSIECVVSIYHRKRENSLLNGETREARLQYFSDFYLNDIQFSKDFLKYFPVLNDLLISTTRDYFVLCQDIIMSYYKNTKVLEEAFGQFLGNISEISLPAGDLHNGKAVTIITFDNGKLVYKPRNADVDRALEEVVTYIADNLVKPLHFYMLKNVDFDNHSWQEFAKQAPCTTFEQVHDFYYRSGVYLAVFFLFSSTDLHYDNMISLGEHPIFFDIETLIAGQFAQSSIHPKTMAKSVLYTNMLPLEVNNPAIDINTSALFTGKHKSKTMTQYRIVADDRLDWVYKKDYITIEGGSNRLFFNGQELAAVAVEDDIVAGYSEAMSIIMNKKDVIEKKIMNLAPSMKVRQVLRPTQVYGQFISACRNPAYACDYNKANEILNILFDKFTPSTYGYLRVEREVEVLKKGYIPSFYSKYNSRDLFCTLNNDIVCKDFFLMSPQDTVLSKLKSIDQSLIEYQVRLISMSILLTCDIRKLHGHTEYTPTIEVEPLNQNRILSILEEYISYISNSIVPFEDDQSTMILPSVNENGFCIHSIDFGLYDSGGLILLLATYGHYHNHDVSVNSQRLMKALICKYRVMKNMNSQDIDYSLSNGVSGFLYVAFNISRLLNDIELYSFAKDLTKDIIDHFLTIAINDINLDYFGGFSGALYLLCKMHMLDDSMVSRHQITELGERFLTTIDHTDTTDLEFGFAHGRMGIAVALAGQYEVTQDHRFRHLLDEMFHSKQNSTNVDNVSLSWCRGEAGWLLGSYLLAKHTKDNVYLMNINSLSSYDVNRLLSSDNLCLCHGVFGNIDVLNLVLPEKISIEEISQQCNFESLMDLKFVSDSKYKYELFMAGGSGVAYILLQCLHDIPSVLALDIVR